MPDAFVVRGGSPLRGTVAVSGAKNSALKLAAAALLAPGRTVLHRVPDIGDIHGMSAVLTHLGVTASRDGATLTLEVPDSIGREAPEHLVRQLRASIVVLGPLLAREGRARVAMPGGCDLGNRSIDLHLAGLARMGAEVTFGPDFVEASAERLCGTDIELSYASVGATENLLMAAVTAEGTTRIGNAAREPEIVDLAGFLRAMGADISGEGTAEIVINGVARLTPVEHTVVPDRIEAGTFAVAAVVTGGRITLSGAEPGHLRLPLDKLRQAGAVVEETPDGLVVGAGERLAALDIVTLPYPGFPTDLQPLYLVLLTQAAGTSMVTENVFDGRFSIVGELHRLGADMEIAGHHIIVRGPASLRGAAVRATDLRAGAALVVAGLCTEGETVISEPVHVDRGYADLAGRLRSLGATIERRTVEDRVGAA
jgi:UDP-N-acetylglucosamine 1-carboxyvinyltransferase